MRKHAEIAALLLCGVAVGAYVVSFITGIGTRQPVPVEVVDPTPRARAEPAPPQGRVRVEVLNGSGRSGLARAATERLRDGGFDVVYFGNAGATDSSVVLARTEEEGDARAVADRLGIGRVRVAPDTTLLLDVTVLLGKDWELSAQRR